ncbi:lebercilin-like protein [Leptodactylus fuscus]|uniref:lebercilin-like protein n=1 Tax=Leptodactylus fuscus TaxID=238119 RepID=UPI003F4E5C4F
MSFEVSGEDREWRSEPSTDPEERPFSHLNDLTQSPTSDSTSPSDRSKTSLSDHSSTETSERVNEVQKTPEKRKTCQTFPNVDPEERPFSHLNDLTQSPTSDSTSPSDRSKTSLSDHSSTETSERVNEVQKTPEKRKMCQTFPKVANKGFSWRKSPPWKRSSLKPQHLLFPKSESDVTQRILSAQVHKIKELKDELCDVQRTLDVVNRENRLLTRLQHRHMKALQKYESPDSSIHHLISRHSNEIRTLRQSLRATQESERGLSLKLKMAENELLKAKDSLQRLQRLTEDQNLAEREELNNKLCNLLIKMEIDSTKVKGLEKQLHLTAHFYDRQLRLESKKASEARDITRKLQDEILVLQQTLKEKERELHIKNIYARRMPRGIWRYGGLYGGGGLTFAKSTQTESETCIQEQPSVHEGEEYGDPGDKNTESENVNAVEEESNPEMAGQEAPTSEVFQDEENDDFLETDGKYKEQEKESSTEGPILEEQLGLEESRLDEKNQANDLCDENKVDLGRRADSGDTRSFLPRLSRHYTFTIATENLHQGFPASGPIPSYKSLLLQRDFSLGHEELSLPKIDTGNHYKKKGKHPQVSLSDRKKNLMEELFGPGYDVKNSFSNDFVTSEKELNF